MLLTVAGNGTIGFTNGPGPNATFHTPDAVAVDDNGNIYVVDQFNYSIRKITPDGTVSTLAGSGTYGSANGLGTGASFSQPSDITIDNANNLYVADEGNNIIRKITPAGLVTTLAGTGSQGSANGPNATATFTNPIGVAADAIGNVYVADAFNQLIRRIGTNGIVTTLAGNGTIGNADGNRQPGKLLLSLRYIN